MTGREHDFPADHPAVPGHFPGNPVMPGALLLAEVLRCAEDAVGCVPGRIRSAKFLSPVRPGDWVRIECSPAGTDGAVRFRCMVGMLEVLRGEVSCRLPSRRG